MFGTGERKAFPESAGRGGQSGLDPVLVAVRGRGAHLPVVHADSRPRIHDIELSPRPRFVREVHFLSLLAAGALLLLESTKLWFTLDEWDFLAYRGIQLGTHGLFYPHNGQWSTFPILIWRAIFNVVGVRDYWLYALPMIVAHLLVANVLWRLMLRYEVEPWTATVLAACFLVVGVGWANVTWAFQLGFVGSLLFGLLSVEAVERDQKVLPAVWGVCALMFSDIGVAMIVTVGLVALAHRKFRLAAYSALPPAAIFLVWYALVGHNGADPASNFKVLTVGSMSSYVWTGLTSTMGGFVNASRTVGAAVVVILAVAVVVKRNAPAVLAVSVPLFYVIVGLGRLDLGTREASAVRYSYIAVALFLPLIGQVITVLSHRRILRPIVCFGLLFLIGLNFVVLQRDQRAYQQGLDRDGQRGQMEAASYLIHAGYRFPGRFPADSACPGVGSVALVNQCLSQDVPDTSVLTIWVKRDQFPVPKQVPESALRAEGALLGVYASSGRADDGGLTFVEAGNAACAQVDSANPVTVPLSGSGSLRISSPDSSAFRVRFLAVRGTPSTEGIVPVTGNDHWLNFPASTYQQVLLSATSPIRLCET
jgi:hypothetical protein